jgi:hypothetical protein
LKKNKAVEPFVNDYVKPGNLTNFVEDSDYVAFPNSTEELVWQRWQDRTTGSLYAKDGSLPGGDIPTALKQSQ